MPVAILTKRIIDAISADDCPLTLYDTDLKGFGAPGGKARHEKLVCRIPPGAGGRSIAKRRLVLGCVGKLTPDQARTAAKEILAAVALGDDPAASRSRSRKMPIFRDFAERYVAEQAFAEVEAEDGGQLSKLSLQSRCPRLSAA